MATITVDLQEGFRGEHVRIAVDGQEQFASRNVRTSPLVGLAATFSATPRGPRCRLSVDLVDRGVTHDFAIDVASDTTFVGLQLDDTGVLRHAVRASPFGYG